MASRRSHRSPRSTQKPARLQEGRIRLIGGEYKRRLLPVLDSPGLRPTPDRTRETLFNWLMPALHGARVLDLFSGSGALGFEALSRGAGHVQLIERETPIAKRLRENAETLGAPQKVSVAQADALQWLSTAPEVPFDIVFIDPPFHKDLVAPSCRLLELHHLLADGAYIYVELEAGATPELPTHWQLHREARAGESRAYLYKRQFPSEN